MTERRVELEGRTYTWTGRDWYDTTTHMKPALTIVRKLNAWLAAQELSTEEKLTLAKKARTDGNLWLAERVVRDILRSDPHHHGAAAVLSGVLRDRGFPAEALEVTKPFVSRSYAPIFTTRAAAFCDLGRWAEARRELARALVIGGDDEAFAVVRRIKKVRPDLYP